MLAYVFNQKDAQRWLMGFHSAVTGLGISWCSHVPQPDGDVTLQTGLSVCRLCLISDWNHRLLGERPKLSSLSCKPLICSKKRKKGKPVSLRNALDEVVKNTTY